MSGERHHAFEVGRSRAVTWEFLTDPERVIDCLPGARLLRTLDPRTFEGEVGLRLGPIPAAVRGTLHYARIDPERWSVEIRGRTSRVPLGGTAELRVRGRLQEPEPGRTLVLVSQRVSASGRFGRLLGPTLLPRLLDGIARRFGECVRRALEAPGR